MQTMSASSSATPPQAMASPTMASPQPDAGQTPHQPRAKSRRSLMKPLRRKRGGKRETFWVRFTISAKALQKFKEGILEAARRQSWSPNAVGLAALQGVAACLSISGSLADRQAMIVKILEEAGLLKEPLAPLSVDAEVCEHTAEALAKRSGGGLTALPSTVEPPLRIAPKSRKAPTVIEPFRLSKTPTKYGWANRGRAAVMAGNRKRRRVAEDDRRQQDKRRRKEKRRCAERIDCQTPSVDRMRGPLAGKGILRKKAGCPYNGGWTASMW